MGLIASLYVQHQAQDEKPQGSIGLDTTNVIERFLVQVEKRAFRMAYFATNSHDEALDIVQDAMIKLVKSYRDRDEQELAMLFHRILQNQIKDWYRRNKVRQSVYVLLKIFNRHGEEVETDDMLQQLPATHQVQPEQQLASDEAMVQLDKVLKKLPMRQQQAFLLRTLEGMDVSQTARAMGCSQGSVKTHFSRAVHTLREKLGEHMFGEDSA